MSSCYFQLTEGLTSRCSACNSQISPSAPSIVVLRKSLCSLPKECRIPVHALNQTFQTMSPSSSSSSRYSTLSSSSLSSSSSSTHELLMSAILYLFHPKCLEESRHLLIQDEKDDKLEFDMQTLTSKITMYDSTKKEHQTIARVLMQSPESQNITAGLIGIGCSLDMPSFLCQYSNDIFPSVPFPLVEKKNNNNTTLRSMFYHIIPLTLTLTFQGQRNNYPGLNNDTVMNLVAQVLFDEQQIHGHKNMQVFFHAPALKCDSTPPKLLLSKFPVYIIFLVFQQSPAPVTWSKLRREEKKEKEEEEEEEEGENATLLLTRMGSHVMKVLGQANANLFQSFYTVMGWKMNLMVSERFIKPILPRACVDVLTCPADMKSKQVYFNVGGFDGLTPVCLPKSALTCLPEEERNKIFIKTTSFFPSEMAVAVIDQGTTKDPLLHAVNLDGLNALFSIQQKHKEDIVFSSFLVLV